MKQHISFLSILSLFIILSACGSGEKKSDLQVQVESLAEQGKYLEAIKAASNLPKGEQTEKIIKPIRQKYEKMAMEKIEVLKSKDLQNEEVKKELSKVHLDFGIYLEYYGDHLGMRERMTTSLAHLRRAYQLDETNVQAKAEIDQIEGIYKQMGRPIPEEIAN